MSFVRNESTWNSWALYLISADNVERGICKLFSPSQEYLRFVDCWPA